MNTTFKFLGNTIRDFYRCYIEFSFSNWTIINSLVMDVKPVQIFTKLCTRNIMSYHLTRRPPTLSSETKGTCITANTTMWLVISCDQKREGNTTINKTIKIQAPYCCATSLQ